MAPPKGSVSSTVAPATVGAHRSIPQRSGGSYHQPTSPQTGPSNGGVLTTGSSSDLTGRPARCRPHAGRELTSTWHIHWHSGCAVTDTVLRDRLTRSCGTFYCLQATDRDSHAAAHRYQDVRADQRPTSPFGELIVRYELQVDTACPWRRREDASCTRLRRRLPLVGLQDDHVSDLLARPGVGPRRGVGEWTRVRSPVWALARLAWWPRRWLARSWWSAAPLGGCHRRP
jgi:hypothetical protein